MAAVRLVCSGPRQRKTPPGRTRRSLKIVELLGPRVALEVEASAEDAADKSAGPVVHGPVATFYTEFDVGALETGDVEVELEAEFDFADEGEFLAAVAEAAVAGGGVTAPGTATLVVRKS